MTLLPARFSSRTGSLFNDTARCGNAWLSERPHEDPMPGKKLKLIPLVTLLAAAMALASCGRKGDLDPPSVAAKADSKYGKRDSAPPPAPNQPFLLDPLL